jgi:hypothetical protein
LPYSWPTWPQNARLITEIAIAMNRFVSSP